MAKKGPKIKELSRELGVTSHAILVRCAHAGVTVQNSASRLDPATADRVRGWFIGGPPGAGANAAALGLGVEESLNPPQDLEQP